MNHPVPHGQLEGTQNCLVANAASLGTLPQPCVMDPQALLPPHPPRRRTAGYERGEGEEVSQSLSETRVAEQLRSQKGGSEMTRRPGRAERCLYRLFFQFGPDAYLVTDAEGNIREANRAAGKLLGINPSWLIKKPLIIFVAEEARDEFRRLAAAIRAGQKVKKELSVRPRNGSNFVAEIALAAARTRQGNFLLHWMIRDLRLRWPTEASTQTGPSARCQIQQFQAIGRMLDGLADTSRHAMEQSWSGLEKLASEIQDRPQALQWLAEIQHAQEDLRRLHQSISDFAVPVLLE